MLGELWPTQIARLSSLRARQIGLTILASNKLISAHWQLITRVRTLSTRINGKVYRISGKRQCRPARSNGDRMDDMGFEMHLDWEDERQALTRTVVGPADWRVNLAKREAAYEALLKQRDEDIAKEEQEDAI